MTYYSKKLREIKHFITEQEVEIKRINKNLVHYNALFLSKRRMEKTFNKSLSNIESFKVEDEMKGKVSNIHKLFTNVLEINRNQISDKILEFDRTFNFTLNGQDLSLDEIVKAYHYIHALKKKCGTNFSKCLISKGDIAAYQKKYTKIEIALENMEEKILNLA